MGLIRRKKTTKQKAFMFFTTVGDIASLFMAVIYIAYVALMLTIDGGLGVTWLNWTMFGITVAYIAFFFFKIFYLNRVVSQTGKVRKIVNRANKYTKLGMRLINAAFVITSMIALEQLDESHIVPLIGVFIVGITFVVSILVDIGAWYLRKKIHELTVSWHELSQEEKSERVELFLSGFIRSINNNAIVDDYFDVGMNIKRMVGAKMSERIRLADARRVDPYNEDEQDHGNEEVDK
jgi:hypothetical protein